MLSRRQGKLVECQTAVGLLKRVALARHGADHHMTARTHVVDAQSLLQLGVLEEAEAAY